MDFLNLIISLISGAVGGNIAGAALKDQSLGTVGNSIAGILGGGVGGMLLQALGASVGGGGLEFKLGFRIGLVALGERGLADGLFERHAIRLETCEGASAVDRAAWSASGEVGIVEQLQPDGRDLRQRGIGRDVMAVCRKGTQVMDMDLE